MARAAVALSLAAGLWLLPATAAQSDDDDNSTIPYYWQCANRGVPAPTRNFADLMLVNMGDLPNNNFCRSCDQDNCDQCSNDLWRIRDGSCGWNTGQYHYGGGGIGWVTVDLGSPTAVGAVKVNGYQGGSHDPRGPFRRAMPLLACRLHVWLLVLFSSDIGSDSYAPLVKVHGRSAVPMTERTGHVSARVSVTCGIRETSAAPTWTSKTSAS